MYSAIMWTFNIVLTFCTIWGTRKAYHAFWGAENQSIFCKLCWIFYAAFILWSEHTAPSGTLIITFLNLIFLIVIAITGYQADLKNKIIYVSIWVIVWVLIEMLVYLFILIFQPSREISYILGSTITKIIVMVLAYWMDEYKFVKNSSIPNLKYYFFLLLIPFGSVIIAHNLFVMTDVKEYFLYSIVSLIILLVINVINFEVYAKLSQSFLAERENAVYEQQINSMLRYTEEQNRLMEEFYQEKHDFSNQLIMLANDMNLKNNQNFLHNLGTVIQGYNDKMQKVFSGNSAVDSIMNCKYSLAKSYGIEFETNIFIPVTLPVGLADLGIVIGNLLDNAIDALKDEKNKDGNSSKTISNNDLTDRTIHIDMGIKKEALIIHVQNPYRNQLLQSKSGAFHSTKENKLKHGYGLKSVQRVADQYKGNLVIQTENGIFDVIAVLNI